MGFILKSIMLCLRYVVENEMFSKFLFVIEDLMLTLGRN